MRMSQNGNHCRKFPTGTKCFALSLWLMVLSVFLAWHQESINLSSLRVSYGISRKMKLTDSAFISPSRCKNESASANVVQDHFENLPRLFVHVGKAGGSAMRAFRNTSHHFCRQATGILDEETLANHYSDLSATLDVNTRQYCALGHTLVLTHVNQQTHVFSFDQFLVTVRNPIDRLKSWYGFEQGVIKGRDDIMTRSLGGQRLRRLMNECGYGSSFSELVERAMISEDPEYVQKYLQYDNYDESRGIDVQNTTAMTIEGVSCHRIALDCLSGREPCFSHNYFNYEVYLEELLLWKGAASRATGRLPRPLSKRKTTESFYTKAQMLQMQSSDVNLLHDRRDIRVDVIRSEHSVDDMNRTFAQWTGQYGTAEVLSHYRHKNVGKRNPNNPISQQTGKGLEDTPSPEASKELCQLLCKELIAYKKILQVADNLSNSDKKDSIQYLDETCTAPVDQLCGNDFVYRNIKRKKIYEAPNPWG